MPGETSTLDNTGSGRTKVYAAIPPWDSCDRLRRWKQDDNASDGRTLTVVTNIASEGEESFAFYHRSPSKYEAYFGFDQVYENWSNKTALLFDLYVADGSTNVQVLMRTGSDWTWYSSPSVTITSGWNHDLRFNFASNVWTREVWNEETQTKEYVPDQPLGGLEEMQQLFIKVLGYPDEGTVYVDHIRLEGWYTLNLAYWEGVDLFPRARAEQSNYTAAACGWMIAKYLTPAFSQTQTQIYNATAHDAGHNHEITPAGCASWMQSNAPAGFYFSARYRTNAVDALKEVVYWMDYLPPGGLQTPVYLVCGTNWNYKVARGFQADRKPYDGAGGGVYTVFGMWLNDPRESGLGYNVFASAAEMASVFQPAIGLSQFWMVAEPPEDPAALDAAVGQIERSTVVLSDAQANPALASFLRTKFGGARRLFGGGGGDPNLAGSLPKALAEHEAFADAFGAAPVVAYYAVNTNGSGTYYLAAGGERGPGSTRYVLKLATNGAVLQATWSDDPAFYQVPGLDVAEWAARQQVGTSATLQASALVGNPGDSPFVPAWQLQFDHNGTTVYSEVRADIDLSGDADGDGVSDGQELYTGQDPNDALSVFSIEGGTLRTLGPDKLILRWPSKAGRTYSVHRAVLLGQPFTRIASQVAATAPENEYVDEPSSARAFYKVVVE